MVFTEEKKQSRLRNHMDLQSGPQNLNPTIYERTEERATEESDYDNEVRDEIDRREIFDLIRSINDPEHPLTLEGLNMKDLSVSQIASCSVLELHVVDLDGVAIDNQTNTVQIKFRPTIPHCSM